MHCLTARSSSRLYQRVREELGLAYTVYSYLAPAEGCGNLTVYAGVNGDFFRISSDYSPIGLTVKEGVVINENTSGRGYVGFTADGECIIDDKMYATSGYSFKTAVGGNQILLRNGLPYNTGTDDEFSLTAHPRTLVGVRADGTVLLVVIDGRQSSHSNGAPLKRCAKIMFDLGASSALNVDGGGSSTMYFNGTVVNNPTTGGSTTKERSVSDIVYIGK
jgi:exopolysaccharide biosynthesis protein